MTSITRWSFFHTGLNKQLVKFAMCTDHKRPAGLVNKSIYLCPLWGCFSQGSHALWKSLKVLEFENQNSRPWKSVKSTLGPWKTLKFAVWLFTLSRRTRKDWEQIWQLSLKPDHLVSHFNGIFLLDGVLEKLELCPGMSLKSPWIFSPKKSTNVPCLVLKCLLRVHSFGVIWNRITLGARGFFLVGVAKWREKNLWYQRITTSLPRWRQFPLIDIRSQSLF